VLLFVETMQEFHHQAQRPNQDYLIPYKTGFSADFYRGLLLQCRWSTCKGNCHSRSNEGRNCFCNLKAEL